MWLINRFIAIFALFCVYPTDLFAEVNNYQHDIIQLYDQGQFKEVTRILENRVTHESEALKAFDFYALGNAYFKQGLKGRAMAAFLKASELAPRSDSIAINMKKVSSQGQDKLSYDWPAKQWKKAALLYRKISMQELFYLGSSLLAIAGFFICIYLFSARFKRGWIVLSFTFIFLGGYLLGIFFAADRIWPRWGAVINSQAEVYSSPSTESGVVLFKLNDGAPVMIEARVGIWSKIALSDGKRGWIEGEHLSTYFR